MATRNRLAESTSPYLLQHADNPVDWHEWGPEALALATELDKPIFLSIGYAACHWCHVMAHESFEDGDTAALMNEHFVNVKVDREERPDVDSLYMDAVVAMTGQGGWPMSVFLTPEGKPFFGGTYFPPDRRFNMPAFKEVLLSLAEKWQSDRASIESAGNELTGRIALAPALSSEADDAPTAALLDQAAERLFRSYDWSHGGWGRAPKFPQPMSIEFQFRRRFRTGDKMALDMASHALKAMAAGGIYDHLAGGFARYSVDEIWLVPHFEKMLYDNVQLARAYVQAWQITGNHDFRRLAEETLDFVLRDMWHAEGGMLSSYDADSEGEEGKFYVWSLDEIQASLDEPELFVAAYGVTQAGNFEGKNILYRALDDAALAAQFSIAAEEVAERLASDRERLRAARERRVAPGLDDKVITAWNGLGLIALAEAGRALGRGDYIEMAQLQAGFLLENLIVDGRLRRSWRSGRAKVNAFLEDHAALGLGLLAVYQANFDLRWYRAAVEQAEEILEHFTDAQGGFFDTRHDHERLIARPKSVQDSPIPSGNTLAAQLLLTLGAYEGDTRYTQPAEASISAMAPTAAQHPSAFAGWLNVFDFMLSPQLQLAISGDPASADFGALLGVPNGRYLPNLVLAGGGTSADGRPQLMADRPTLDGAATAYLCQGFVCQLPTTEPESLVEQIEASLPTPDPA